MKEFRDIYIYIAYFLIIYKKIAMSLNNRYYNNNKKLYVIPQKRYGYTFKGKSCDFQERNENNKSKLYVRNKYLRNKNEILYDKCKKTKSWMNGSDEQQGIDMIKYHMSGKEILCPEKNNSLYYYNYYGYCFNECANFFLSLPDNTFNVFSISMKDNELLTNVIQDNIFCDYNQFLYFTLLLIIIHRKSSIPLSNIYYVIASQRFYEILKNVVIILQYNKGQILSCVIVNNISTFIRNAVWNYYK
nr:MAG: hypothetical protein [Metapenaeopsis lamellata majanivirus]